MPISRCRKAKREIHNHICLKNNIWYCSRHQNHNKTSPKIWQIVWNTKNLTSLLSKLQQFAPPHWKREDESSSPNTLTMQKMQLKIASNSRRISSSKAYQVTLSAHYYKSAWSNCTTDQLRVVRFSPESHHTLQQTVSGLPRSASARDRPPLPEKLF